ncbi:CBS domain-containing protein [Longispora sp. K20-0274]|uniref:CBS domain-containing protein n=1 Tax=Longispora sp. K20-0274 TaxID=3088255 RepID=UPI00399979F1
MGTKISDVMSPRPVTVAPDMTLVEAARQMRDDAIGDVIVAEAGHIRGIVTDRDIVVRAIADDRPAGEVTVGDICSAELTTVAPDDKIERAIGLMRHRAIRRLPVIEDGRVVGVVSLGDLAIERDDHSVLADISAAVPNF